MINELKGQVARWSWGDEFVGNEMADFYESYEYNDRERCFPVTRIPLMILFWRVRGLWGAFLCAAFGHRWNESYADAENGYEFCSCERCGYEVGGYMT
jgi:hypothetical protein